MGIINKTKNVFDKLRYFASTPLARRLVLGLFVVQAVILVFVVNFGTPPDENNHIRFIEHYANHSISPIFDEQQPTPNLGDKTREVDYLYHYSMSLLYRVLPFSAEDKYTVIRLITVLFALLSMLVLTKVFKKLDFSPASITTGLLILTNLPMVLMMSSAVNNDVLVWLGAALGILLLLDLWKRPSATSLLWLGGLSITGGLVKRNLLPLCMVFGLLGLIIFVRHFSVIWAGLKKFSWQICAALVLIVLGTALFTERVGGNVVRYGSVAPSCEQVQGEAACYNFWASARARDLAKRPPERPVPPVEFVTRWVWDSAYNVVDIQTQWWRHQVGPVPRLTELLLGTLAVGVVYGVIYESKRARSSRQSRQRLYVLAIALFFVLVQLAVNYSNYQSVKVYGIALNGRYVIPSLLLLGVFASLYWSRLLSRWPRLLTAFTIFVIVATMAGSGLTMMLRNPQLYGG